MYKSLFEKIIGLVGLTGITILDGFLIAVLAILIHRTVYSVVGLLYECEFIQGKIAGKICYFIIWILSLIGCVYLALICQAKIILMGILICVLLVYNIIYGVIRHIRNA